VSSPACEVNDVQAQLNRTTVGRVIEVDSVSALQHIVRGAAAAGLRISIAGGRHSMGGQQFGDGAVLLDMTHHVRLMSQAPRGEQS
jgi:FAD/FMN-containing dehydrogenase